ncbi:hypothetical protein F5876DRAFT_70737, partial [Lentinula aff. lateritia]
MTTPPAPTSARVSHAPGALPSPPNCPSSNVDEILLLFKSIFGLGVSLARYIVDDPLWSILAAAGLPCPTCIQAFACRFLEIHGDPGQRTCYSLPTEQWQVIYDHVEQRTDSTSALLELNSLDDQDQWELDCQELQEFLKANSGTTPKHQRPGQPVDRSSPIAPTVPQVEGASNYHRVVLVLRPPHVPDSELPTLPEVGCLVPVDSSHRSAVDQSRSQGYDKIPHRIPQAGLFEQFVPPREVEGFSGSRIKTPPVLQHSREPLRPYPRPQASLALRAENDCLKTEVEELRTLLAQAHGQVSTLTSLLRDTSSSLDLRNQELEASCRLLEEVAGDCAEYYRVLSQFRAIEAELPEPPSEEVAKSQKQEIVELYKQVDDATNRSSNAYAKLDSVNSCAMRQRDCLEELEEM